MDGTQTTFYCIVGQLTSTYKWFLFLQEYFETSLYAPTESYPDPYEEYEWPVDEPPKKIQKIPENDK